MSCVTLPGSTRTCAYRDNRIHRVCYALISTANKSKVRGCTANGGGNKQQAINLGAKLRRVAVEIGIGIGVGVDSSNGSRSSYGSGTKQNWKPMKTSTCVMNATEMEAKRSRNSKTLEKKRGQFFCIRVLLLLLRFRFRFWLNIFVCSEALHFGLWGRGTALPDRRKYEAAYALCFVCLSSECFDVKAYAKQTRGQKHTLTHIVC